MRIAVRILSPLISILLLLPAVVSAAAPAAEKSPFHDARAEGGELKFIHGVPVLLVVGTPREIGRQKAALTGEAAKAIADYPRKLLRAFHCEHRWPTVVADGRTLLKQAPADYREELQTFGKELAVDADSGVVGNTIMDTYRGWLGCSSLLVSAEKSATDAPCSATTSTSTRSGSSTSTAW